MPMRLAISSATKQLAKPCCPWNCGGISVLLAKALAIRWASSNAWMPLNTEPELVVVSAVDSVIKGGTDLANYIAVKLGG